MTPSSDISTILNRILDTAADNLRVAKILVQLGLDPNNITYDAIFNRLLELFLANITLANLDAPAVAMWHRETALHWAASNDDVALVDALLDAGADIEHDGSSIDGGPPLSSAVGYGQWEAARRLVARGARTLLWHEAALGMMPAIVRRFETDSAPQAETLSGPLWNACHGGQLAAAQYLLGRGADLNWAAPWSGQTPLDIAERSGRSDVVTWLLEKGAIRGKKNG